MTPPATSGRSLILLPVMTHASVRGIPVGLAAAAVLGVAVVLAGLVSAALGRRARRRA